MIKLSDYLDYLNNEIIQARKKADENAVLIAKEYARHEYLKYFKVPRYALPSVKMDIPIKITDIDSDSKYNFKLNQDQFVTEINERIRLANKEKNLNISEISKRQLQTEEFKTLFSTLEKNDQKFGKLPAVEVLKLDLRKKVQLLNSGIFRPQEGATEETDELKDIFSKVLLNKYTLVNAKLNSIYIDPNTSAAEDKDKLFINLHVEMEEEGIRIVSYKDKDGNEIEQITFE
ncbi:uncharacterized protein YfkK (UPF0435 family) [Chryseobacterium bernardetii]|uniref:Uncharacterized protein n=3 Tax=Chryseobacterium TaxID=59732 RepID=A0A543DV39_9FLAO|nr:MULTISPECIES: hypothetical protein [Chryseobacterium]MDR6373088.1 uncharacterized protein YfkK (UPF0435 family) [Chryseobacterium vietnamense]MDR6443526.1 uncharacterized protein YfkK (UPF0435 family) [Chryseobacterium bernardetii]MDR6461134.1 uncharacterized protein YfkK (UPF0435 family) [Chryseobacterium vietnamense]MDR6490006.1 uncharacterized protein YfkK (UPF0435 family) [Chryseobacterium vietnamense]TQM13188.1 hypothetical protein FB551_4558 [Chryseobacterium aquifrigidense]